jgi:hypothetical protein
MAVDALLWLAAQGALVRLTAVNAPVCCCCCCLQNRQWSRLLWAALLHADEVSPARHAWQHLAALPAQLQLAAPSLAWRRGGSVSYVKDEHNNSSTAAAAAATSLQTDVLFRSSFMEASNVHVLLH